MSIRTNMKVKAFISGMLLMGGIVMFGSACEKMGELSFSDRIVDAVYDGTIFEVDGHDGSKIVIERVFGNKE